MQKRFFRLDPQNSENLIDSYPENLIFYFLYFLILVESINNFKRNLL